jgi:hypothetical protein
MIPTVAESTVPSIDVRPTYVIPADGSVDSDTARWIRALDGEPVRIQDVTDICATHRVTAVLCGEPGEQIGRVFANGRYEIE